jgi:hypothetical protein
MFSEALAGLQDRNQTKHDEAGWLRFVRKSGTAFLSGSRGTGKTTVFTSLVAATQLPAIEDFDFNDGDATGNLKEELRGLRGRLIWLEPIDLESSPTALNPLAALFARVDAALVRYRIFAAPTEATHMVFDHQTKLPEALANLKRLETNVALGWNGNLDALGSKLTPESFAQEVMRTENARLSLAPTITNVLDALAEFGFKRAGFENPVFVLPIDDFDLAPELCLHLLRMIRMIWVPRLFFLLLGDLRVAETVIHLGLAREFATLTEGAQHPEIAPIDPVQARTVAAEVAANAFRKLIPPSQRVNLDYMQVDETIAYPYNLTDPRVRSESIDSSRGGSLFQLLGKIGVQKSDAVPVQNLQQMLFAQPLVLRPSQAEGKPQMEEQIYSARAMFRTTPRRAADLWLTLRDRIAEAGKGPLSHTVALDIFGEHCRTLIQEDPLIALDLERDTLAELRKDEFNGWTIGNPPISVSSVTSPSNILPGKTVTLGNMTPTCSVHVRSVKGWVFEPKAVGKTEMSGNAPALPRTLSTETGSAVMLFHDLLAIIDANPDKEEVPSPFDIGSSGFTQWATTYWDFGQGSRVEVNWPGPAFSTFWEYDQFRYLWNSAIPHISTRDSSHSGLDLAAYAWILCGTLLWETQTSARTVPWLSSSTGPFQPDWKDLEKRIQALRYNPRPSAKRWLVSILAMAEGTEYGVSFLKEHFQAVGSLLSYSAEVRPFREARLAVAHPQYDQNKQLFMAEIPPSATPAKRTVGRRKS